MHRPIPGERNWPKQVVNGLFVYYTVPTNFRVLLEFRAPNKRPLATDATAWQAEGSD
jgi:hypothetical protein